MRLSLILACTVVLVASAGCLDAVSDVFDRGTVVRAPDDLVLTGGVTPGFQKTEEFRVPEDIRSVAIAMALEMAGVPTTPPVTPATLEVKVLSPDGTPVGPARELDAQKTRDTLTISNPGAGTYTIELSGNGVSDGSQGATYRLEVTYTARSS